MRIAIDARYLSAPQHAIARYCENLIANLAEIDTENQYFIFINPHYQRRLRVGDNFKIIPYKAPQIGLRTLLRFGKKINNLQCDFLHSLAPAGPLLKAPPNILTLHDFQPIEPTEPNPAETNKISKYTSGILHRLSFHQVLRKATWVICPSHAIRHKLIQLFPDSNNKVIVAYPGVDNIFRKRPESTIIQMVNKKLDLPPKYLLNITQEQTEKPLLAMLKAFAGIIEKKHEEIGNLHLLIAMNNPSASTIITENARKIGIEKNIRTIGPITEAEKQVLYHKALALFAISTTRKLNPSIPEAQAAGLPVIATNNQQTNEITQNTAILVNPNDKNQIANATINLLLDKELTRELSKAGKQNTEKFKWEKTAQTVYDIYRLLM